jgi:asparagine synthase (glutamine-hydrolysing)
VCQVGGAGRAGVGAVREGRAGPRGVPLTLWAGVYVRDGRQPVPSGLAEELARALSRRPNEAVAFARFDGAIVAFAETGAFDRPSVRRSSSTFSIVAGEPFLARLADGSDRDVDIARLHEAWSAGDYTLGAQTTGTFAAMHYDERTRELSLIADKLGVRPIYFAITESHVFFANALRMLEALPALPKTVDVRGAIETLALGYPLADRTPYRDVYTIKGGEVVTFQDRAVRRRHYWRITEIGERNQPIDVTGRQVHDAFASAVRKRSAGDRRAIAFLSGGLDSRCMVAEVLAKGVELHTFNFADDGTKDHLLGDAFAAAAGTIHARSPRPPDPVHWSLTMAERWAASPHRTRLPVDRPGMVWSGDGGSVGLGFVGVYPSVIVLLRAGRRDEAVERYCAEHEISLPLRVFRKAMANEAGDVLRDGLRQAFDEARSDGEPGRDLYFFRMQHDQRRHLALHFEDVDLHRLEFHLPFYDADLITVVAAAPPDHGVGHRLYNAALPYFPSVISSVAWQTYPGHEPCPIPLPRDAIDQWGDRQRDIVRQARRAGILREAARLVRSADFPSRVLDRRYVAAAGLMHWLGRGDYSYVMDYAASFSEFWRLSQGRWRLDPLMRDGTAHSGVAGDELTTPRT